MVPVPLRQKLRFLRFRFLFRNTGISTFTLINFHKNLIGKCYPLREKSVVKNTLFGKKLGCSNTRLSLTLVDKTGKYPNFVHYMFETIRSKEGKPLPETVKRVSGEDNVHCERGLSTPNTQHLRLAQCFCNTGIPLRHSICYVLVSVLGIRDILVRIQISD